MPEPSILVQRQPGYRVITLNRLDRLALIKRALDAATTNTFDAQLDLERDLQREAVTSPDYAEGVRAFMEKRKPQFSGRK